jgi:hypothetical protein
VASRKIARQARASSSRVIPHFSMPRCPTPFEYSGRATRLVSFPSRRRHCAAKTHVRHPRVRRAPMPGAGPVASAVCVVAEERSAFLCPLRTVGLTGVEALFRSRGVDYHALAGSLAVEIDLVPVVAPLPDVTRHVIEAVAVGREGDVRS